MKYYTLSVSPSEWEDQGDGRRAPIYRIVPVDFHQLQGGGPHWSHPPEHEAFETVAVQLPGNPRLTTFIHLGNGRYIEDN